MPRYNYAASGDDDEDQKMNRLEEGGIPQQGHRK